MSDLFNEEQQAAFDKALAEKQKQWKRQYDGYLSPDDVAEHTKDLNKQIADLNKALNDSNKKIEDFTKQIAKKDEIIKKHETSSVKTRIAHEAGLSYDAIAFLSGDDEESIAKSAESLKKLMGTNTVPSIVNEPPIKKDESREAMRNLAKGLSAK